MLVKLRVKEFSFVFLLGHTLSCRGVYAELRMVKVRFLRSFMQGNKKLSLKSMRQGGQSLPAAHPLLKIHLARREVTSV